MELTSLVSGMTEFAANLYPLKTEEELVALLSGMHHFPPGVPERARRVHERLPAGSALCSSDVGVLIDRLDTEGGLDGLYRHLAHTKEGPLHLVPSITHCAVCALIVAIATRNSPRKSKDARTVRRNNPRKVGFRGLRCGGTMRPPPPLPHTPPLTQNYLWMAEMAARTTRQRPQFGVHRPRAQRAPCLHTALADSFTLPSSSQAPQAIKRSAD